MRRPYIYVRVVASCEDDRRKPHLGGGMQKDAHAGTAACTRTPGLGTVGSWVSAPPPLASCL